MTEEFADDRPILTLSEDKLGFAGPAKHVAKSILHFASPEGFVFGLEGAWGSGKSSLVNLIIAALQADAKAPAIVKFSPWLISSRHALLDELFREIAIATVKALTLDKPPRPFIDDPIDWWREQKKRRAKQDHLKQALSSFANHLSRISKLAELGELIGVPYAGTASKGLQAAGKAAGAWSTGPSLEEQRDKLKSSLRDLPRKIVIFVDDLDRLEPNEAGEVVRLVRAVADFPNIVYVLCYSQQILGLRPN